MKVRGRTAGLGVPARVFERKGEDLEKTLLVLNLW